MPKHEFNILVEHDKDVPYKLDFSRAYATKLSEKSCQKLIKRHPELFKNCLFVPYKDIEYRELGMVTNRLTGTRIIGNLSYKMVYPHKVVEDRSSPYTYEIML